MRRTTLIAIVSLLVMTMVVGTAATRSKKSEIIKNLDLFNAVYRELQTTYVDTIDATKSINTAISSMLYELDPYTEYISDDNQDDLQRITTGEYAGIGSDIVARNNNVYVSGPREGSPAAEAGLKPGDLIMVVNGDTMLGKDIETVSKNLRGQPGTHAVVTVKRPYVQDSILTFDILRRKINVTTLPYYGMISDEIGYIVLTGFNEKSAKDVKDALLDLKKNPNFKSLVIDLRGNGGGLLESAVNIVGLFVPKGTEVLHTRGRDAMNERVYKTTANPIDTKLPLVILVDNGTASSSEILSGTLQDLDRAVIVGTRTYGKGLVQSTRPLPYNGILKVTVAKYYIPSGRLIQAIDYRHRNEDGSVSRIPDSLTNVYYTAGGREVRDGGGIKPDLEVVYPDITRLYYNIVADMWSFDYANKYASEHASIPPAKDFVVDDTIFNDFKKFIDPAKFKYDKVCENGLTALRDAAKREGYANDSLDAAFNNLEKLLKHDLDKDLDINKNDIKEALGTEIAERYYYDRGRIIQQLKHDEAVDSAVKVLSNINRYNSILAPVKKGKK